MYATKLQRAMTYFLDFLIIEIIVSLLCQLVYLVLPIDRSLVTTYENLLVEETEKCMTALASGSNYDVQRLYDILFTYLKHSLVNFAIVSSLYLVLVVGYLVILPMLWDKQTIGRLVMKVKVVSVDGSPVTKKQIVIRELVGTYLFYCIIGGPLILATVIIASMKGRSLVDYVAKTNLVTTLEVEVPECQDNDNNDYIDAEVKDINTNDDYVEAKFVDDSSSSDDEDEYKII